MQDCQHLILHLAFEINQQVAAGDEVEVRERRILEHAVSGKDDEIAHLFLHPIVVSLADEIAAQPILGHVRFDRSRVPALPRRGERAGIEIAGKDLHFRPDAELGRLLSMTIASE